MIISTFVANKLIENYEKNKRENYINDSDYYNDRKSPWLLIPVIVGVIFMVMEFLVLFYAVGIAIRCTTTTRERIVHLVLAITFTLPYMLVNAFFGDCAKGFLSESINFGL
jgi:hypothetical protein